MKKSHGIVSLKKAAKLLDKHAPEGESLAYINPEEAKLLKSRGGSGIMTLAGVPSYWKLPDWVPFSDTISSVGTGITDWLGYTGGDGGGGGQLMKDLASLWGGYEGFKESEELSEFQKQQYQEQKGKEVLNELLFAAQTDSGKQLLAPQNVPTSVEDISVFKEATGIPQLKTTAVAQGGRIGYDNGGASTLMASASDPMDDKNQISLRLFGKPLHDLNEDELIDLDEWLEDKAQKWQGAQGGRIGAANGGIQSLNQQLNSLPEYYMPYPAAQGGRIGYGSGTVAPNRPYTGSGNLAADLSGLFSSKLAGKKYVSPQSGNVLSDNFYGKMLTSNPDAIQAFSSLNDADLYAEWENYIADGGDLEYDEWKETRMVAAQGGRIGAYNGGIQGLMPQQGPAGFMPQQGMMPQQGLMPRPGFAFGTEVVEDTTVTEDIFSQVPPEMKMADLDNLPEFFLIELEELIEDYFEDIGERPRTINDIEKWYRHKGQSVSADERPNDEYRLDELKNQRLPEPPEWYNKEIEMAAQGGRIGAQGGGIMPLLNLGGMEKDYRQDGGFVPIGRKEKADDVPARLSKNEFVFTADAVRAAGGGDIDDGAQRMYNVMKNLEAGGKISQQSQGQG